VLKSTINIAYNVVQVPNINSISGKRKVAFNSLRFCYIVKAE